MFLSFRSFEKLALVLKTEFALKFFKLGGLLSRTPMGVRRSGSLSNARCKLCERSPHSSR